MTNNGVVGHTLMRAVSLAKVGYVTDHGARAGLRSDRSEDNGKDGVETI